MLVYSVIWAADITTAMTSCYRTLKTKTVTPTRRTFPIFDGDDRSSDTDTDNNRTICDTAHHYCPSVYIHKHDSRLAILHFWKKSLFCSLNASRTKLKSLSAGVLFHVKNTTHSKSLQKTLWSRSLTDENINVNTVSKTHTLDEYLTVKSIYIPGYVYNDFSRSHIQYQQLWCGW